MSYAHPISTQAPQSVPLQPILRNPTDVAHTAPVARVMSQYSPSNTQTNTGMASAELDTLMGMAEEKTMLIGNYPDEKSDQKEGPSLAVDHCVYSDALMNLQHNENSTLLTTLITTKADSNMLCLAAFGTARPLGSGDTNTLMMQLLNLSNQASALKIEGSYLSMVTFPFSKAVFTSLFHCLTPLCTLCHTRKTPVFSLKICQ